MLTIPEYKSDMYSNENTQLNMLVFAITFNLPVIRINSNIGKDILVYVESPNKSSYELYSCSGHLLGPLNKDLG